MHATFLTDDGPVEVDIPRLEAARVLATLRGFTLDLEPMGPGQVVIRASDGAGATFTVKGENVNDASRKLIQRLVGQ